MKPRRKVATAGRHFVVSTVLRNMFVSRRRSAPYTYGFAPLLSLPMYAVGGVGDGQLELAYYAVFPVFPFSPFFPLLQILPLDQDWLDRLDRLDRSAAVPIAPSMIGTG